MISLPATLVLVWLHVIADFVLQSDEMATKKSTSNQWLALHVLVYSACFLPLCFGLGLGTGLAFCAVNYAAHFITDYVTSRMTSSLWKEGRRHAFFVVIGIDQGLHLTALTTSYWWLLR